MNQENPIEIMINMDEKNLSTNSKDELHDKDHELNVHGIKGAVSLYIATSIIHLS